MQPIQVYSLEQTPQCRLHKSAARGQRHPSPPFSYATDLSAISRPFVFSTHQFN